MKFVNANAQCTCWDKAPTVPVFRDQGKHLDDCPLKDSGLPVGTNPAFAQKAEQLRTLADRVLSEGTRCHGEFPNYVFVTPETWDAALSIAEHIRKATSSDRVEIAPVSAAKQ